MEGATLTRCPVSKLFVGQRVDLESDAIADPVDDSSASEHPEFAFAFEVVFAIERETPDCIRVDFDSGFSCGFPPDHELDVDGEQDPIKERLEYLRGELRAERISMGELAELQGLAAHIEPGDVELLEAAGVPEFADEPDDGKEGEREQRAADREADAADVKARTGFDLRRIR